MANNQTIRIRPIVLQADQEAHAAVNVLSDYNPPNPAFAKPAVQAKLEAMQAAQEAELNAKNALASARDNAAAAEWEYHNTMLGVKVSIIAQYGDSSNELQSLGLKKKSEHKLHVRKKTAG